MMIAAVATSCMLAEIYYGIVKILRHLHIHNFTKKYLAFPFIAQILALKLHLGGVYLFMFHGFCSLLKLLYVLYFCSHALIY